MLTEEQVRKRLEVLKIKKQASTNAGVCMVFSAVIDEYDVILEEDE